MKSWEEIKKRYKRGDFVKVAALAGCDARNVEYVVKGLRPDNYNIQQHYSHLLAQEDELARKAKKMRKRTNKVRATA